MVEDHWYMAYWGRTSSFKNGAFKRVDISVNTQIAPTDLDCARNVLGCCVTYLLLRGTSRKYNNFVNSLSRMILLFVCEVKHKSLMYLCVNTFGISLSLRKSKKSNFQTRSNVFFYKNIKLFIFFSSTKYNILGN